MKFWKYFFKLQILLSYFLHIIMIIICGATGSALLGYWYRQSCLEFQTKDKCTGSNRCRRNTHFFLTFSLDFDPQSLSRQSDPGPCRWRSWEWKLKLKLTWKTGGEQEARWPCNLVLSPGWRSCRRKKNVMNELTERLKIASLVRRKLGRQW